jgi:hypothetical protein
VTEVRLDNPFSIFPLAFPQDSQSVVLPGTKLQPFDAVVTALIAFVGSSVVLNLDVCSFVFFLSFFVAV